MHVSPQFGAKLVFDTNTMRQGKPTSDKEGAAESEAFKKQLEEALPQLEAYPDMTLYVNHNFAYSRAENEKHTTRFNFNSAHIVTPNGTTSVSRKERRFFGPEPITKYLKKILAAAHQAGKLKPKQAESVATPQATPEPGIPADAAFKRPDKPPFPYV
jgi:hypothetical protein